MGKGSFTSMPHLDNMDWTPDERLLHVKRGTSQTWYTYDSTGQRVRKVTEKAGFTEERLYLGGFEIYRKRQGTTVTLERETLHLMDGNRRIAMVETKTVDTSTALPLPSTVTRYQLDNHLQSASLELDETASVISYEEYYPYGDTSYRSARSGVEVSEKRYRYTGKEKDEETGLYYHGARYYAAWLGRWTAADPSGMVDGACLYAYVRNHPTGLVDPDGRAGIQIKDLFREASSTLTKAKSNILSRIEAAKQAAKSGVNDFTNTAKESIQSAKAAALNASSKHKASAERVIESGAITFLDYLAKRKAPGLDTLSEKSKQEKFAKNTDETIGILTHEYVSGTGKSDGIREFSNNTKINQDLRKLDIIDRAVNDFYQSNINRNPDSLQSTRYSYQFSPSTSPTTWWPAIREGAKAAKEAFVDDNWTRQYIGGCIVNISPRNDSMDIELIDSKTRNSLFAHASGLLEIAKNQTRDSINPLPLSTTTQKYQFREPLDTSRLHQ